MTTLNTPKAERTSDFYRDAFTESTTWGAGNYFEAECAAHGIIPATDEFFCHTADRLWSAMSDEERSQFVSDYDDWLDA